MLTQASSLLGAILIFLGSNQRRNTVQPHSVIATCISIVTLIVAFAPLASAEVKSPAWISDLSDETFRRAEKEKKLVLLDLEAVWCHWCHVMHRETYSDPEVKKLIEKHFVPVRIDQDSRPDLSALYEDYGWPATIILDSKGRDIARRSGFVPAQKLSSLLRTVVSDPKPLADEAPEVQASTHSLSVEQREKLVSAISSSFDMEKGGLAFPHHFLGLEWPEYVLRVARAGNGHYETFMRLSLDNARKLHDPVWGGAYQYSTGYGWDEPHFEKIASSQANNLRAYTMGLAIFNEDRYALAAHGIVKYLRKFLRDPEGAFYTSQDADVVRGEHAGEYFSLSDVERRKLGVPKVDTNIYPSENGPLIACLAELFAITGDATVLSDAIRAAEWVVSNRVRKDGSFGHSSATESDSYLRDTLEMGRAFLTLYIVTAERRWLDRSVRAADVVMARFVSGSESGFLTAAPGVRVVREVRKINENVATARYFNLLRYYTGNAAYGAAAERAMLWLAGPSVLNSKKIAAGTLMADFELSNAPLHVTIVGAKGDSAAKGLFSAALKGSSGYRRLEWWDPAEGPLVSSDIRYPRLKRAAAFVCTGSRCSLPITNNDELSALLSKINIDRGL